ncbi:MAG: hypothetical protein V9G12_08785 [Microthrixaceae bacterium]
MRFKRRWAIAITAAACVAAGPGLVSGPANVASAAPADIPWFERPVTVGTGFRLGTGATTATAQVVSASGRWVAFTSTAADLLPGSVGGGAFLRDRWTDTTTRPGAGVAGQLTPTRMSHDGNLIAGSGSDGSVDFSWIHDQRTRRTTSWWRRRAGNPPRSSASTTTATSSPTTASRRSALPASIEPGGSSPTARSRR